MSLKESVKVLMVKKADVVHMVPQKPIKQMRGFVRSGDSNGIREEIDRF